MKYTINDKEVNEQEFMQELSTAMFCDPFVEEDFQKYINDGQESVTVCGYKYYPADILALNNVNYRIEFNSYIDARIESQISEEILHGEFDDMFNRKHFVCADEDDDE